MSAQQLSITYDIKETGCVTVTLFAKFQNFASVSSIVTFLWRFDFKNVFSLTWRDCNMIILYINLISIFDPNGLCILCTQAAEFDISANVSTDLLR